MDQLELVKILNKYNPWWENKPISSSKTSTFHRGDFYLIKENLKQKQINSIIGPRRVGKTILMHQLIQDLLQKIDPKRILYLSVDEVDLNKAGTGLKEVLETYSHYIIQKPLDSLEQTHYLFLDEIQELPEWAKILKNWYDFGYNLKFCISGSSSLWINKGTEESLLGRIRTSVMMPLKFTEILRYRGILGEEFFKARQDAQEALLKAMEFQDHSIFVKALESLVGVCSGKKDQIEIELNRYIVVGGYPEFLDVREYRDIEEAVRDKIKLIFFKDIIRYFKIRNPEVLEDLFTLLAKNSGSYLNIIKTAKLLDIQRPTLKEYIQYLKKAFLIESSEFYSLSRRVRIRKQEKMYVLDPGIRNAVMGILYERLLQEDHELGIIVEGILFDHLSRLKFKLSPGPHNQIFYWKDKKEIDFIIDVANKPLPVESKYRNKTPEDNIQAITQFMLKHKSPLGMIITKQIYNVDTQILKIPLWVFLLLV